MLQCQLNRVGPDIGVLKSATLLSQKRNTALYLFTTPGCVSMCSFHTNCESTKHSNRGGGTYSSCYGEAHVTVDDKKSMTRR